MSKSEIPLTLLLVRHATPIAPLTPGFGDDDRPLTAQGLADAERLAELHLGTPIDAIYSSPYPRAFQTVEPLARRLGLTIEVLDDLRERRLTPTHLHEHEWKAHVERSWRDFDYAPAGAESGRSAQERARRVLEQIRARHPGGTVMAGSHGNLITLALNTIDPALHMDFWRAMPMPAVYELRWTADGWRIVAGPNVR